MWKVLCAAEFECGNELFWSKFRRIIVSILSRMIFRSNFVNRSSSQACFVSSKSHQERFVERSCLASAVFATDQPSPSRINTLKKWKLSMIWYHFVLFENAVSLRSSQYGSLRWSSWKTMQTHRRHSRFASWSLIVASQCLNNGKQEFAGLEGFPLKCKPHQCLFCVGDSALAHQERFSDFKTNFSLQRLVEGCRSKSIGADEEIACPHSYSLGAEVVLHGIKHFKNHAATVHDIFMWSSQAQHTQCWANVSSLLNNCRFLAHNLSIYQRPYRWVPELLT